MWDGGGHPGAARSRAKRAFSSSLLYLVLILQDYILPFPLFQVFADLWSRMVKALEVEKEVHGEHHGSDATVLDLTITVGNLCY